MRVAGFDIGSNTLLMLVADIAGDGAMTVVSDQCEFGRLGQGVGETATLAKDAIARSLDILRRYAEALAPLGAERIGAVATQAVRAAANANDFLAPASEILGIEIEVISGSREAELTYLATKAAFPQLATDVIVLGDVGGASTEVVIGRGNSIRSATSIPIGAVTLAEKHLRSDPSTPSEAKALFADIDQQIATLEMPTGVPLVGTAGTATTFASVELRLPEYDGEKVQGLRLPRARVERHLARFLELTLAEKRRLVGLEPERADVIAAGAAIYVRLMAKMNSPTFITSGRGVRFGLAAELGG